MIYDLLTESSKDKSWNEIKDAILTRTKTFYEHAVKYKHNPVNQSTSWYGTIRRVSGEIKDLLNSAKNPSTIIRNISKEEYKSVYETGVQKAINDGNVQCKNKTDVFEEFPTIKEITNSSKVEDFIHKNAKHPYVVDALFKECVDFDKYLESLTEADRETLSLLKNPIDYVNKEELANFLKPDAPEIYKESVIEYLNENKKEN